jgi:predicted  nucleic acid-binding Zn-ribbon protein
MAPKADDNGLTTAVKTALNEQESNLKRELGRSTRRISELTDRITTLENNLNRTQELLQKDMNRLITMMAEAQQ